MDKDPFAALGDPWGEAPRQPPQPKAPDGGDPFSGMGDPWGEQTEEKQEATPTAFGAGRRAAARSLLPSAAGIAGFGAGMEAGAIAGSIAGPAGTFVGGLAGGLLGSVGASWVTGKAQDAALSKLPDSWQDALGQSESQRLADEKAHPIASFIGGTLPFLVTMRPGAAEPFLSKLPENATGFQRLLANPTTSRVFGGGLMGGIELGQEYAEGDVDWRKVAISTGMGLILNKQTGIGDTIMGVGTGAVRRMAPAGALKRYDALRGEPTVAQAGDENVAGPGVTEEVFHGTEKRDPAAQAAANDAAATESIVIGSPEVAPDPHDIARRMEPDLFARKDALEAQLAAFRQEVSNYHNPPEGAFAEAEARAQKIQEDLSAHIESQNGYTGGKEARGLRAELRDAEAQLSELKERQVRFSAGGAEETPELAAIRQHIVATDQELRDLGRDVAAAYRRAEEHLGGGRSVYPAPANLPEAPGEKKFGSLAEMVAATDGSMRPAGAPEAPGTPPEAVNRPPEAVNNAPIAAPAPEAQNIRQQIVDDVARRLRKSGIPEDQASANAELIASYYMTRAARFEGKRGTGLDLYRGQAPDIKGPNGRIAPFEVGPAAAESRIAPAAPVEPKIEGQPLSSYQGADQVRDLLRGGASVEEISNHPYVKAANARLQAIPTTDSMPGYGTPEWKANREFTVDGEKHIGYEAGENALVKKAESYSTDGPVATNRQATIVIGPPAAGKSTISERIAQRTHSAIADVDDAKAALPEFQGGIGANATHEESSEIGGAVLEKLVAKGANVIIPKVGHNKEGISKLVDQMKADGYDVHLVNIDVTPENAFTRMIGRFLSTGRLINPDYFNSIGDKPLQTYNALKGDERIASHANVESNGPPGTQTISEGAGYAADAARGGRGREVSGPVPEAPAEERPAAPAAAESGTPAEPVTETHGAVGGKFADQWQAPWQPHRVATETMNLIDRIDAIHDRLAKMTPEQEIRDVPKYRPGVELDPNEQVHGPFMFNATALNVDANRFQFKSGGDEYGVTGALRQVQKWDKSKADQIIVWEDRDGKLWVADGHQRTGLARRLVDQGKADQIEIAGTLLREVDGVTAEDAKAFAAVKNIAAGTGTAIDGAKVLRARPDMIEHLNGLSIGKSAQAQQLARLDDEAWRMVVNDVVPEHQAAMVGEMIPNDAGRQIAAMKAIAQFEPRNEFEARTLIERVKAAELTKGEAGRQGGLFDDFNTPESTAGEEMKIVAKAIKGLEKDRGLFKRVVANAERIEETGSHIEQGAAKAVVEDAGVFAKQLASDAYAKGPVRDALVEAARELKNGDIRIGEATDRVLAALRRQAEEMGAGRRGGGAGATEGAGKPGEAGAPEAREFAQESPEGVASHQKQVRSVLDEADTALSGEAADAITQFVGHEPGAVEAFKQGKSTGFGVMRAGPLEDSLAKPDSPVSKQLEESFAPFREKLRAIYGDKVRLYRVQNPIVDANGTWKGGKRSVLSWTADPNFADEFAGVKKEIPVHTEEKIAEAHRALQDKGVFEIRKGRELRLAEDGSVDLYDDNVGGHVTGFDRGEKGVREFFEGENDWARERQEENAKSRGKIISAEVPLDDVVFATDRAGQSEFIVRNKEGAEHHIDEHGLRTYEPPERELFQRRLGPDDYRRILEAQRATEGMRAAMRDPKTGIIYTGGSHQAAIESVPKSDDTGAWGRLSGEWDRGTDNTGFVDKSGKFISRAEAEKQFNVSTMEDLRDLRRGGRELFQRRQPDDDGGLFEAGAEGLPQKLVPGVAPVTDRERLRLKAAAPLKGGNAPMQEGGLFGEGVRQGEKQGELFQMSSPALQERADDILKMMKARGSYRFPVSDQYMLMGGKDDLYGIYKRDDRTGEISEFARGNARKISRVIAQIEQTERSGRDRPPTLSMEELKQRANEAAANARLPGVKDFRVEFGDDGQTFTAYSGDRLIGTLELGMERMPADIQRHYSWMEKNQTPAGYVTGVKVEEPYRRMGVARELYKTAEAAIGAELVPSRETLPDARAFWGSYRPEALEASNLKELEQRANGKIRIAPGKRSLITMAKTADASTFMHESGHQFLEDLMADAMHEHAPAQLKDDADTVLKWLGAKSAEDIKDRHHEKFARGFEQYLREGVAPSPGLANVFHQFKTWLMTIYQTLRGLGKPISEDIRSVFDRMLAETPERTILSEPKEAAPSLPAQHEAAATQIHPADADAHADRIKAEADLAHAEAHPEVAREAQAAFDRTAPAGPAGEPAGKAGGGAPESGPVEGGGAGSKPVAGGGAPRAEPKPELRGGGAPEAEGAGLRGGADAGRGVGDSSGDAPFATRPAERISDREPKFVDKAGNIRVENLTTNKDVADAIHEAADANHNYPDQTKPVSDGQVMELADALGMRYSDLLQRKVGQAFNAVQVIAARKLLVQSATEVAAAMKKAANGTDADVLAYAQVRDRHHMIQGQVAGITAEAGRALRAFRDISMPADAAAADAMVRQATGRTLFQLKMEAQLGMALNTPEQISAFMRASIEHSYPRMVLEYWINGLISGPATHVTYIVGNNILSLWKAIPETAAAAMIGSIRKSMGREGETVQLGEVWAGYRAKGQSRPAALQAAIESFRTGQNALLPGEKVHQAQGFGPDYEFAPRWEIEPNARYSDVMASAFGALRGIRDGFTAAGGLLKAGGVEGAPLVGWKYSNLGAIPNLAIKGVEVLPTGTAARLPSRFVAAIHSYFKAMNYSMDIAAQSFRKAAAEGLEGEAFNARVADLRQRPTEEMMQGSVNEALNLTLMGTGGEFTKRLSALTNYETASGFKPLKFIDPFVHISSNIISEAMLKRSPVGLLSAEIRKDLSGANGNIAQDKAMARMLVGTATAVGAGLLAAEGYLSGSGPSDRNEAAVWRMAGNQAHSVRIGDVWYDIHKLGPLGLLMSTAADMYEVSRYASEGEMTEVAAHLHHAFMQNVLDESFMRGPADLIKAIEDPGRYGTTYVNNLLSSFVPFSVGQAQIARAMDPYSRRARTLTDSIRAKIPGLSEDVLPRRDIWGEPIQARQVLGIPGASAIWAQEVSKDPVNIAMAELGIGLAPSPKKIRNVELTDEQYDDFSRISGRAAKMRLDTIVNSAQWQNWPDHVREQVIREAVKQARESARGLMMMKYPQIMRDAVAAKREAMSGGQPPVSSRGM